MHSPGTDSQARPSSGGSGAHPLSSKRAGGSPTSSSGVGSSASGSAAPDAASWGGGGGSAALQPSASKPYPQPAGDVLLELRGVAKSFGNKDILRGASMQIRRGEAVGIIGGSALQLLSQRQHPEIGAINTGEPLS